MTIFLKVSADLSLGQKNTNTELSFDVLLTCKFTAKREKLHRFNPGGGTSRPLALAAPPWVPIVSAT